MKRLVISLTVIELFAEDLIQYSNKETTNYLHWWSFTGLEVTGNRFCCGLIYITYTLQGYRKTSNISRTLVGNKIVDHSDVVGASPVGAAPTTSSFST